MIVGTFVLAGAVLGLLAGLLWPVQDAGGSGLVAAGGDVEAPAAPAGPGPALPMDTQSRETADRGAHA